jgi:ankyrin repeat protein
MAKWLLVEGGASVAEADNYGRSALLIAAATGRIAMLHLVLAHGADLLEADTDAATQPC